jgi:hypothetical protein
MVRKMKKSMLPYVYMISFMSLISSCDSYRNVSSSQSNYGEIKPSRISVESVDSKTKGFLVKNQDDDFDLYDNARFEAYAPSGRCVGTAYTNYIGQGSITLPENYSIRFISPKDTSMTITMRVSDIGDIVDIPSTRIGIANKL